MDQPEDRPRDPPEDDTLLQGFNPDWLLQEPPNAEQDMFEFTHNPDPWSITRDLGLDGDMGPIDDMESVDLGATPTSPTNDQIALDWSMLMGSDGNEEANQPNSTSIDTIDTIENVGQWTIAGIDYTGISQGSDLGQAMQLPQSFTAIKDHQTSHSIPDGEENIDETIQRMLQSNDIGSQEMANVTSRGHAMANVNGDGHVTYAMARNSFDDNATAPARGSSTAHTPQAPMVHADNAVSNVDAQFEQASADSFEDVVQWLQEPSDSSQQDLAAGSLMEPFVWNNLFDFNNGATASTAAFLAPATQAIQNEAPFHPQPISLGTSGGPPLGSFTTAVPMVRAASTLDFGPDDALPSIEDRDSDYTKSRSPSSEPEAELVNTRKRKSCAGEDVPAPSKRLRLTEAPVDTDSTTGAKRVSRNTVAAASGSYGRFNVNDLSLVTEPSPDPQGDDVDEDNEAGDEDLVALTFLSHEDRLAHGIAMLNRHEIEFYENGFMERNKGTDPFKTRSIPSSSFNQGLGRKYDFSWNSHEYKDKLGAGSTRWRWPIWRIKQYMENGWNVPDHAFHGPYHPGRSNWVPANTDCSVLGDMELSLWEIIAFFPLTIGQYNVSNRFIANGWKQSTIADAINWVHNLPPNYHIKADTVKHKVLASDKKRYGGKSWAATQKNASNPSSRPNVTDFTAGHMGALGGAFDAYDKHHDQEDPFLVNLAGDLEPQMFPQNDHRGPLTAAVEYAVINGLKEYRLSDVPEMIVKFKLDQGNVRRVPMTTSPNADTTALARFREAMKGDRTELKKSRKREFMLKRQPKGTRVTSEVASEASAETGHHTQASESNKRKRGDDNDGSSPNKATRIV